MEESQVLAVIDKAVVSVSNVLDGILDAYKRGKEIDLEIERVRAKASVATTYINAQIRAKELCVQNAVNTIQGKLALVEKKLNLLNAGLSVNEKDRATLRKSIEEFSRAIINPDVPVEFRSQLMEMCTTFLGQLTQLSSKALDGVLKTNEQVDKYVADFQISSAIANSMHNKMIEG